VETFEKLPISPFLLDSDNEHNETGLFYVRNILLNMAIGAVSRVFRINDAISASASTGAK